MQLLLDTHALLWWLDGDEQMSATARVAVSSEENTVWVSAASAWEVATKVRIGRLPGATEVAEQFGAILLAQDFSALPITIEHARQAGLIPGSHRDPFDRMLIAQAQLEGLVLVSDEKLFDGFGIRRLW